MSLLCRLIWIVFNLILFVYILVQYYFKNFIFFVFKFGFYYQLSYSAAGNPKKKYLINDKIFR